MLSRCGVRRPVSRPKAIRQSAVSKRRGAQRSKRIKALASSSVVLRVEAPLDTYLIDRFAQQLFKHTIQVVEDEIEFVGR